MIQKQAVFAFASIQGFTFLGKFKKCIFQSLISSLNNALALRVQGDSCLMGNTKFCTKILEFRTNVS